VRGRPPIPTRLKEARGTLRADRRNRLEPHPAVGFPPPRRGLSKPARAEYRRLEDALAGLNVATLSDALALELCAQALSEYHAAVEVLLRDGASYECTTAAGSKLRRPRPEQAIATDAWRRAALMLQQFGLTPASRSKVNAQPDELAELLLGITGRRHAT
jgi:P27 family predicted phage terminase small subunit